MKTQEAIENLKYLISGDCTDSHMDFVEEIEMAINALEQHDGILTADVVEVVRCKDCVYYEIHKPRVFRNCERNNRLMPMNPNDFCSCGERKDGAE